MRKIHFILFALLFFGAVSLQAQDEFKHEVSFGGGYFASSEVLDFCTEASSVAGTFGSVEYDNKSFTPPISLEYFYHLSPLVGVGGIAVYTHGKRDIVDRVDAYVGKLTTDYITVMPAAKFNWLRKMNWGLYSKVGAGVSFRKEKSRVMGEGSHTENDVIFNFQATLIGVEAGSSDYRGFIELGLGEQGIINAGVRLRF